MRTRCRRRYTEPGPIVQALAMLLGLLMLAAATAAVVLLARSLNPCFCW
jgi:hypothetical protein